MQKVVTSEQEKKALLNQLSAHDMTELDVYVLKAQRAVELAETLGCSAAPFRGY